MPVSGTVYFLRYICCRNLQDQCSLEATHGEMVKDESDDSSTKKANNKKGIAK